jgi:HlyD family secretion protein
VKTLHADEPAVTTPAQTNGFPAPPAVTPAARRRRKGVVLAVAAAALAAVASVGAWHWWNTVPSDVFLASGNIEATEVHPSFKVSGRLIERPVDEGSRVEPGALIGRIESKDLEADAARLREALRATETQLPLLRTEIKIQEDLTASRISQARAALVARQEYLGQLKAGSRRQEIQQAEAEVSRARVTMDNAEADSKRFQFLFDQGLIAAQQRDTAWTAYRVAAEQHRAALEKLDLTREGPRPEEIRRAEADVHQAQAAYLEAQTGELVIVRKKQELATLEANVRRDQAALAGAEATLGYTVLQSPLAGVVLRKHVEPGEVIPAGTPIVTIADLGNIWVKIYVPEPRLGRVKLGQAAEVTTDSYPGRIYRGRVSFINSEAEFTPKTIQTFEERVKLVFAVKVTVDNPAQELKPGMPADARILLR